jgi:hypothetical protein
MAELTTESGLVVLTPDYLADDFEAAPCWLCAAEYEQEVAERRAALRVVREAEEWARRIVQETEEESEG